MVLGASPQSANAGVFRFRRVRIVIVHASIGRRHNSLHLMLWTAPSRGI
jgi:hypothetical protein